MIVAYTMVQTKRFWYCVSVKNLNIQKFNAAPLPTIYPHKKQKKQALQPDKDINERGGLSAPTRYIPAELPSERRQNACRVKKAFKIFLNSDIKHSVPSRHYWEVPRIDDLAHPVY